jgi:transmembrane sensor
MIMSNAIKSDDIDDIAAQWVLRQDRGEMSPEEQRELDAWLQSNSLHLGAFVRAQAIWVDLDRVAALNAGRAAADERGEKRRSLARVASFTAVFIATAATLFAVAQSYLAGRETTQLGEMRRITLNDGSAVALNTASVMQVRFARDERHVVLRRGEASFQVAHDKQRPFVVDAGDVSVLAVGTAFTVRMREEGDVTVVVTDGVVEVTRDRGILTEQAQKQRAVRDQEVIVAARQPMTTLPLSKQEIARRLAWEEGQLVFDGERLDEAVAEVNRYVATPVRIESDTLAAKSFVGVFRTGDARAFAYAAAAAFNAHVHEDADAVRITD